MTRSTVAASAPVGELAGRLPRTDDGDAVVVAGLGAGDEAGLHRRRQLDHAVRQVGAGRFHLTCFAAVIDPDRGEIHFANAGHVAPYVCRARAAPTPAGDTVELSALVARGNPLGAALALKNADPQRYSVLDHPGDEFSYDIFSQAGGQLA